MKKKKESVSNELFFYYLAISSGLIKFDDYIEKLHELFLADAEKNDILLDLEFCTGDPKATVITLKTALYDIIDQISFEEVGKILFNELRKQYRDDLDTLKELSHKLYMIWTLLPAEISDKQPFITLCFIDDFWAWNGKDEVIKAISQLMNYYNT